MPKYMIKRGIPKAGSLTVDELQAISQKSCGVLNTMGSSTQWVESFVPDLGSAASTLPLMTLPSGAMPNRENFPSAVSPVFDP